MSFKSTAAGAAGVVTLACAIATGATGAGAQAPDPLGSPACPVKPDPATLPSAAQLRQMNSYVAKLGARPTRGRAHALYIAWIRKQLKTTPGLETSALRYKITRWSARRTTLE